MPDNNMGHENLLSDFDVYLLGEGRHRDMANCLGAQLMTIGGISGVRFAVWAPNAQRVSVVGNFNTWNGNENKMRPRGAGLWEIFIPGLTHGEIYKYEIIGPHGLLPLKADPVARQIETPPATGSIIANPAMPPPGATPLRRTAIHDLNKPLSIYEVHASSWMPAFRWPALWLVRACGTADPLRQGSRLHPYRTYAHHGPPVQRFLGLPAAQPIRTNARVGNTTGFCRFHRRLP